MGIRSSEELFARSFDGFGFVMMLNLNPHPELRSVPHQVRHPLKT